MSNKEYKDILVARIRKDDKILAEHFSKIKPSDYPYEIRRLLEMAIKLESKKDKWGRL